MNKLTDIHNRCPYSSLSTATPNSTLDIIIDCSLKTLGKKKIFHEAIKLFCYLDVRFTIVFKTKQ